MGETDITHGKNRGEIDKIYGQDMGETDITGVRLT
jgi:hypothetical protein